MEEKTQLNEMELNQVLSFAQGLYEYLDTGVWNPFSVNQNLLHLNNSPLKVTFDKLIEALENSLTNAEELQGYSQFMYVFDAIYSKTIRHYENMLAFNLSFTCNNIGDSKNYSSKEYKEDLKRLHKFLDRFDYKKDFRNTINDILKTGIYYGWFRDSYGTFDDSPIELDDENNSTNYKIKRSQNFALQTMPQKYCKLTGYWEGGLLYDFDMNYFNSDVDINLFDPIFKVKYAKLFKDDNYNPSAQLMKRNGKYAQWAQTSPMDGAVCIKFDYSNFNVIPPFANLMKVVFDNDEVQKLQKDKNMASAYNLIYGSIGVKNDEKGSSKSNNFKIDPKTMGRFLNLVSQGMKGTSKVMALPLDDPKSFSFSDQNPNMLKTTVKNSADQGAFASDLIYSENKNIFNSTQSLIDDYNVMRSLYVQYARVLQYFANKKTKKYKFNFTFDGSNYPFEREYRRKSLNELFTVGLVPNESYIASVYDIKPQDFSRMLEESKYGDLTNKLTLLLNKNTMSQDSNEDSKGGNPIKDDNELKDGGALSREYE